LSPPTFCVGVDEVELGNGKVTVIGSAVYANPAVVHDQAIAGNDQFVPGRSRLGDVGGRRLIDADIDCAFGCAGC
jgi:hypothetical protein